MLTSKEIAEYSNTHNLQERVSFEGPHNIKLTYYLSVDHNEGYFFSSNGMSLQVHVEPVTENNQTKFKYTAIISYKDKILWNQTNTIRVKNKLNSYIQNFFFFYLKPCQLEKAIDFLLTLDMKYPNFFGENHSDFAVHYTTPKSDEKVIEQPFYLDKKGFYAFDYELQERFKNFTKLLDLHTGWLGADFFKSLDKNIVYISLFGFSVKKEYFFDLNKLEYMVVTSNTKIKEGYNEHLKSDTEKGKLVEDVEYFIKRAFIGFISREKAIELFGLDQEAADKKRELTREEIDLVEMLFMN